MADRDRKGAPDAGAAAPTEAMWTDLAQGLRRDIGVRAFDHWLKPVRFGNFCEDTGTLTLFAQTSFSANWVADRFLDRLTLAWRSVSPGVTAVRIIGAPQRAELPVAKLPAAPAANQGTLVANQGEGVSGATATPLSDTGLFAFAAPAPTAPATLPNLDPRLVFDNFVSGRSNILALNAARRMAAVERPMFNPLYLQSGTGQGKTHLLHSIAHGLLAVNPAANIILMSAEKFMLEFVTAVRGNDMPAFKARLRAVDLLMIDDLQFIIGKGSTQEELLHTIDEILGAGKRLVVAADRAPHLLDGIDPRLLSRLQGGLVAEIDAPDLALREAILRHKCATHHEAHVPEEVIAFLATSFTRNIRELEGALNKLLAYASLADTAISLDLARDRLAETARGAHTRISIDDIQRAVCAHYKLDRMEMASKRRAREVARPRQIAMYLAKTLTPRSYPEIGRKFGGRDHSTVIHAIKTIESLRVADPAIDSDIARIRRALEV